MLFVADCHVHIYPCFDLDLALTSAFDNLSKYSNLFPYSNHYQKVIFLTERADCRFFKSLKNKDKIELKDSFYQITCSQDHALYISKKNEELLLIPGRQIISEETVEVIALTRDLEIPDGLPLFKTISIILEQGAVPVLAWAPGKWFFKRGMLICKALKTFPPEKLLLADNSLRANIIPPSPFFVKAKIDKRTILAGSDPLPFPGEEVLIGSYASAFEADWDRERPVNSIKNALTSPLPSVQSVGRRSSLKELILRLRKNNDVRLKQRNNGLSV